MGAPAAGGSRQALFTELWHILYESSVEERRKLLDDLVVWAGARPTGPHIHRRLTPDELVTVSNSRLIEIGAHTVNHPPLGLMPTLAQRQELVGGREYLEQVAQRPIRNLSYPHGSFTAETTAIARALGFTCGCTTSGSSVRPGADPFELSRVQVENWDGETFARKLWSWWHH